MAKVGVSKRAASSANLSAKRSQMGREVQALVQSEEQVQFTSDPAFMND